MKKILWAAAALSAALFASCGSETRNTENIVVDELGVIEDYTIFGSWAIDEIVENDSMACHPSEIDPEVAQTITFHPDSTFGVVTNCNSIGGGFAISGDTIIFGDMFKTEMACDNMVSEEMISRVLPTLTRIEFESDSVTKLIAHDSTSRYILLHKIN